MNSFDDMGNAILLAHEGQKQIAQALLDWFAASTVRVRKALAATLAKVTPSVGGA